MLNLANFKLGTLTLPDFVVSRSYNIIFIKYFKFLKESYNPSFRIHGQIYHRIGPLFPNNDEIPKYAQMYIYDTEHEINNRTKHFKDLNKNILSNLQSLMHEFNPFINKFKQFALDSKDLIDYKVIVKAQSSKDRRNYNIPESSEIAAILPSKFLLIFIVHFIMNFIIL